MKKLMIDEYKEIFESTSDDQRMQYYHMIMKIMGERPWLVLGVEFSIASYFKQTGALDNEQNRKIIRGLLVSQMVCGYLMHEARP